MFVFKAAVVGAGTMGGQIAQTIAAAGFPVVLKDVKQEFVDAGLTEARNVTAGQVGRLVKKGKLTEEQAAAQVDEVLARIHGTTGYDGFGDVDFVIEAVPEKMEIKQAVFAELDACTPGHAILASNTSSLSITEIGDATLRPEKVVGFHYFYPASVMPLIEIIESDDTSQETIQVAVTFAQAIKKQPITCAEVPGFVVNRILNSGTAEIWRDQEEQGLDIKKIDEGIGARNVIPMGPFFLVNLLGLDTVLHVGEHLLESYGPERFYVHEGMRKLVADKQLGAKTGGAGFYKDGEAQIPGDADADADELAELYILKMLIEVVEGDETSPETVAAAVTFAQAIKKQPITCAEVPGFVVNRILTSGISEINRAQEEQGLSIKKIDEGVGAANVVPMGPFFLVNLLGLDTVLHVAEHLHESYGDRFYVPAGMQRLVADGRLGAKTGGDGFYDAEGNANVEGDNEPDVGELVEKLVLKTFVEACLVLEEGVATHRDIDFGMMAGAGLDPRRGLLPPFMKADVEGLDSILERLENAQEKWGERFEPPTILRRLVAQGRLGTKSGQGFYAYPQADEEQPGEVVKLESRGDVAIAWLANGQMNSISPDVIRDLSKVWEKVQADGVRALVIASTNPFL
ncbi:MAG TPA: 3-hydroxyacyl-CoA dehydrogenase NAD-binding domain-containing protein, partial [Solirubrobacterales bacterium]|nr:3-hydroxyacyl-CoA dehydrogenase NAD-binding domain-containing protein [Solirubrobacterales bacterium]